MSRMSTGMRAFYHRRTMRPIRSPKARGSGAARCCSRNYPLLLESGDLLPVVAELEQDFLGVLAELGWSGFYPPGRSREIDGRSHHARRRAVGLRRLDECTARGRDGIID